MRRHHGSCTWFGEHNMIAAEFLLVQLASVNNSGPEMVIFLQLAEKNHNWFFTSLSNYSLSLNILRGLCNNCEKWQKMRIEKCQDLVITVSSAISGFNWAMGKAVSSLSKCFILWAMFWTTYRSKVPLGWFYCIHAQFKAVWNIYLSRKKVDFAFLYLIFAPEKKVMVFESFVLELPPRKSTGNCGCSTEIILIGCRFRCVLCPFWVVFLPVAIQLTQWIGGGGWTTNLVSVLTDGGWSPLPRDCGCVLLCPSWLCLSPCNLCSASPVPLSVPRGDRASFLQGLSETVLWSP